MNKEKYMRVFLRNLACDKNKKKTICEDVENDIQNALDNGESFEEIIERLGTPLSLANEFNENMGLEVRQSHKTLWIVLGIIGALCIAGYIFLKSLIPDYEPLGTSGLFQREVVEQHVKDVVEDISQDDFEALQNQMHPKLKEVLPQEDFNNAMKQLGDLGEFERITNQTYAETKQNGKDCVVGEIVVVYKEKSVTYTLSFDQDMKLTGLYMK